MKYYLIFIIFTLISCTDSSTSIFPLTRIKILYLLGNLPDQLPHLTEETISGCTFIPATSFFQRLFVGLERKGTSCSITIHSGNNISVRFFLNQINIHLVRISTSSHPTETFIAELEENEVLIFQQSQGEFIHLTHTRYDSEGVVIYQNYGKGDSIRFCLPSAYPCVKTPN